MSERTFIQRSLYVIKFLSKTKKTCLSLSKPSESLTRILSQLKNKFKKLLVPKMNIEHVIQILIYSEKGVVIFNINKVPITVADY